MKTIFRILTLALVLAAAASCSNDTDADTPRGRALTIAVPGYPAWEGDSATRALTPDKTAWADGDALYIGIGYSNSDALPISDETMTAVRMGSSWAFERELLVPAEAAEIVITATYLGGAKPGEPVSQNDFLRSKFRGQIPANGEIALPAFDRLASRIDFTGLTAGDKVYLDACGFALDADFTAISCDPLPSDTYITADADGQATCFVGFLDATYDCKFRIGESGEWVMLDKGDPDPIDGIGYVNRRYTVDYSGYYNDDHGDTDLEVEKLAKERFLAWADECRAVASGNINIDFTLECDIDLTGIDWEPIGSWNKRYAGTFDGNGKTIRGLKVDITTDYAGLFGVVDAGGVVKDLTLVGADVKTTGNYSGVITGYGKGSILGCAAVDSRVESSFGAGAMVGYQDGLIAGCMADDCSVIGNIGGGIVGTNAGNYGFAVVIGCHTRGGDISKGHAGGIVGNNYKDIYSCYSAPATLTVTSYTGVVVGLNNNDNSTVTTCYWKAASGYTKAIGGEYNSVPQEGNCVEITGDLTAVDVEAMNATITTYNDANPTRTCDYHWAAQGDIVKGKPL